MTLNSLSQDSMPDKSPPPPPPPPPVNLSSKIAPAVLKMRTTSPSSHFTSQTRTEDPGPAPTGPYFFYGSLQDPGLLRHILGLEDNPTFRPAQLKGFKCRLWGQYPALLSGDPDDTVTGTVYEVQTVHHAERLANYETASYQAVPCAAQYTDCESSSQLQAHVFLFVGNLRDLSDGSFDLDRWLER
ncbi:unnamed protein product [Penicillium salamii]|nr:unnamed protein product [Penicillium salamii]